MSSDPVENKLARPTIIIFLFYVNIECKQTKCTKQSHDLPTELQQKLQIKVDMKNYKQTNYSIQIRIKPTKLQQVLYIKVNIKLIINKLSVPDRAMSCQKSTNKS